METKAKQKLLSEDQAEGFLEVSRTTLWRLRRSGALPFYKIGGKVRYAPEDLREWLKGQRGVMAVHEPAAFRKESTYLTHGLHRYKGKFYPQLCRALINIASTDTGDLVLDPFMGSGTTLVESAISGIDSIGFDLNPLAHLIAATKVDLLWIPPENLAATLRQFEAALAKECWDLGLTWGGLWSSEPPGDRGFPAATLAEECGLPHATDEIRR